MATVKNLWDILRWKYPASEYTLMAEVSNAAGFARSNSADYIAVNMWPSRGLGINGIELKSFRSDWLGEMKKPKKAESIFQYCDYFWLLTTDDTIANIDEIPVTWGWQCVKGNKIKVMKDAPKLTPIPLDKHFLVSMLRRANDKTNFIHIESIEDRIKEAEEKARNSRDNDNRYRLERAKELIVIVDEFEKSSGLKFGSWDGHKPDQIGETVKFVLNGGTEQIKKDLERLKVTADFISSKINSAMDKFNEVSKRVKSSVRIAADDWYYVDILTGQQYQSGKDVTENKIP